jgi:hypothetical protein
VNQVIEYYYDNAMKYGSIFMPEAWVIAETKFKPYVVSAGMIVSGAAVMWSGKALTSVGYGSMEFTGPFGFLAGTVGVGVTAVGGGTMTLGFDVVADEFRHRFGWQVDILPLELLGGDH